MRQKYIGYGMAITGSTLWGISGVVAQTLFADYGFATGWLVPMRMICSGVLLLLFMQLKTKQNVTLVWKEKESRVPLLLFAMIGLLGAQYSFFASIQAGNAATATLLQSLCPFVIIVYTTIRKRQLPTASEILALPIAFLGVYLLVTNGSPHQLSVSVTAIVWGLLTAVFLSFNTIFPQRLMGKWGSGIVIGWGMIVGSLVLSLLTKPWQYTEQIIWTPVSILSLLFVIVLGTLVPFFLFLDSVRFITAKEAGLLSNIEPLAAVFASVLWLHLPMGVFESIGAACILFTVVMLSLPKKRKKEELIHDNFRKKNRSDSMV